jgi:hypothetical protein
LKNLSLTATLTGNGQIRLIGRAAIDADASNGLPLMPETVCAEIIEGSPALYIYVVLGKTGSVKPFYAGRDQ